MLFGLILSPRLLSAASGPPQLATPSTLAISQLKITGDEFVVLQNNSGKDITDLSSYWLDYFNSFNPLDAGVSSSSQQLPAVKLANQQTVLLSSNGMATCGASVVSKLSISLGDSGGFLQIIQTSLSSLGVTKVPIDFVSWSSGTNGIIKSVPSSTKDPRGMYYRYAGTSNYAWQLADLDASIPCQLNVAIAGGGKINSGLSQSNAVIPSIAGVTGSANSGLPAADVGLAAPQLSEIVPNPAPPLTDADDEFVELYNSNTKAFDLSGLILQVGTTTLHKYIFPGGTTLQSHKFSAFYSSDTNLSLSNSGGQIKLLDPSGNVLEKSDVYAAAKDGYAWVYANGLWQWTTTPTPGAKNIITTPPGSKSSADESGSSAVLGARSSSPAGNSSSGGGSTPATASGLHPLILAGVGTLAVLYALYEYRHDLANALYRLRRYRAARRGAGQVAESADSFRTTL